jgi:hypothetical protein
MEIIIEDTPRGYSLSITGSEWNAEPCEIQFPEEVWESFPEKEFLRNELAYILTLVPPMILRHPTVWYSTPEPRFLNFYEECFELSIPNMVEPIPDEESEDSINHFRSILRHFSMEPAKSGIIRSDSWNHRRVILPFTFGKDSLLSLATLRSLGYEVIPVHIDERVLPRGNAVFINLEKRLAEEQNLFCHSVKNEIQLLSDYQVLGRPETRLHQVHIYFVYLLAMIPFCFHYRAPTIALSNEYHNSLDHVHREGYVSAHRVMQSQDITGRMARMVEEFSGGQITAVNLLGGLGNFAIHRLLHDEFPQYGKYRISCHLEVTDYSRWCHSCDRCAQPFIYFLACGQDPFSMGFEASMLEEDKMPLYSLFRESLHSKDAYHRFVRREELLAFFMAYRRGARGALMDLFRSLWLQRAEKRYKSLARKIFRLQAKPGKNIIEREAASRYRALLAKYHSRP